MALAMMVTTNILNLEEKEARNMALHVKSANSSNFLACIKLTRQKC